MKFRWTQSRVKSCLQMVQLSTKPLSSARRHQMTNKIDTNKFKLWLRLRNNQRKRKTNNKNLFRSHRLRYMWMVKTVWCSTSSRKPAWTHYNSMQACVEIGRCTNGCLRPAPRWVHRIETSYHNIKATSCTLITQAVMHSLTQWIAWSRVRIATTLHLHTTTDLMANMVLEHHDISTSSRKQRSMKLGRTMNWKTNEDVK